MKITHVNHSSVLIQNSKSKFIWTDPWVISTAFETWTQSPHASYQTIKKISEIKPKDLSILISHGHDDHLDEFILSHEPFNKVKVFIPKLKSPGLKKRIEKTSSNREIIEIDNNDFKIDGFKISNLINPEYTFDDTIFLINNSKTTFIHANDNYHEYKNSFSEEIKFKLNTYNSKNIIYAAQLGIADGFPYIYEPLTIQEKNNLLIEGYRKRSDALKKNLKSLNIEKVYVYANQSSFIQKKQTGKNLLKTEKVREDSLKDNQKFFFQLYPDFFYDEFSKITVQNKFKEPNNKLKKLSIFDYLLEKYYTDAKEYIKQKNIPLEQTNFGFSLIKPDDDNEKSIIFKCSRKIWQRIFIGELTLEAIIVGGCGEINVPKRVNIRELVFALTKWTYKKQSNILKKGIVEYL